MVLMARVDFTKYYYYYYIFNDYCLVFIYLSFIYYLFNIYLLFIIYYIYIYIYTLERVDLFHLQAADTAS